MDRSHHQQAALYYARLAKPLDLDQGWRTEDVRLAFMAGIDSVGVPRLLSLREVADVLCVSPATIHDLVRHGELAFVHAGRGTVRKHLTFSQDEVVSFIKRHTERINYNPGPKTARYGGTRKRAHELAVERATAGGSRFDFAPERAKLVKKK